MIINHPDYDGGRSTFTVTLASRRLIIEAYRAMRKLYPRSVARDTAINYLGRIESVELEIAGICYRASLI